MRGEKQARFCDLVTFTEQSLGVERVGEGRVEELTETEESRRQLIFVTVRVSM